MMSWSPRLQSIVVFALVVSTILLFGCAKTADAAGPEGQITWGVHVSLAPTSGSIPRKRRASSLRSCFSTRFTTRW